MGEGESIIIILIVAAVSVVGLYEFYQWYVTSGYNNPASGTTAARCRERSRHRERESIQPLGARLFLGDPIQRKPKHLG